MKYFNEQLQALQEQTARKKHLEAVLKQLQGFFHLLHLSCIRQKTHPQPASDDQKLSLLLDIYFPL